MPESDAFCKDEHVWPEPGNVAVAIGGYQLQACQKCGAVRGVPVGSPDVGLQVQEAQTGNG